jgi:hypothetical protein
MKKILFLMMLAGSIILMSCKKETLVVNPVANPSLDEMILKSNPSPVISAGNTVTDKIPFVLTRIGSYIIDGEDVTANYKNYLFKFCIDNSIVAVAEDATQYGRWMFNAPGKLTILFDFEIVRINGLSILNADWTITEISKTYMQLVSNAGINGSDKERVRFLRFDLVNK